MRFGLGYGTICQMVLLTLLLVGTVSATTITTQINISTGQDQATISTEEWTSTYSCNATTINNRLINLQRITDSQELVDCRNSVSNLTQFVDQMSSSLKASQAYSPLYTACFANLTSCHNDNNKFINVSNEKSIVEARLKDCQTSQTTAVSERQTAQNELATCSGERNTYKRDAEQYSKDRFTYALLAGAAVFAGWYWYIQRRSAVGSIGSKKGE